MLFRSRLYDRDVWGGDIRYCEDKGGFVVRSPGPDGSWGTADDLTVSVEPLKKEDWPISLRIKNLERQVMEGDKAIKSYSGSKIKGVAGFRFGAVGDSDMKIVRLDRPVRLCQEALLGYYGFGRKYLYSISLVARFPDTPEGRLASVAEGKALIKGLEKKYGFRMPVSRDGVYFNGAYRGDSFLITIQNTQLLRDDPDRVPLVLCYQDTRLVALIDDLSGLLEELAQAEKRLEALPAQGRVEPTRAAPKPEMSDDAGFDLL